MKVDEEIADNVFSCSDKRDVDIDGVLPRQFNELQLYKN